MDKRKLHNFSNDSEFNKYLMNSYQEPFASLTYVGESSAQNHLDGYRIDFDQSGSTMSDSVINNPLTFEVTEAGNIYWTALNDGVAKTISYAKNGGSMTTLTAKNDGSAYISVQSGDIIKIYGDNATYNGNTFSGDVTTRYYAYGNIMSMISSTTFTEADTLSSQYAFSKLFANNVNILSHPDKELFLPAMNLVEYCYMEMFKGCTNLDRAPELPAKKLSYSCYQGMFSDCPSLTYSPELNATTLVDSCYQEMFYDCYNLATITCKATYIKATNCTKDWVVNVAETGRFNNSPYQKNWSEGVDGIPVGWVSEGKTIADLGYVVDGLVFFYDGLLNGNGMQHDSNTSTWYDLSDNGYNLSIHGSAVSGGMWTDKCLKLNCLSGELRTVKNVQIPTIATLEIVYNVKSVPNSVGSNDYPLVSFPYNASNTNYNFMGFYLTTILDPEDTNNIPVLRYKQISAGVNGDCRSAMTVTETNLDTMHYFSQSVQRPIATSTSNVLGVYDASGMSVAQGSFTYGASISDATTMTGLFSIGNNDTFSNYDVEVYSVRMYDRKLTENELKQNWRNDKRRYIN